MMATTLENRRIGREQELKKRMRETLARYEVVFKKVLTVNQLADYLDEEEKRASLDFLRTRMGVLNDADIKYIRNILGGSSKAPDMPPIIHEEIEEIDIASEDDEEL